MWSRRLPWQDAAEADGRPWLPKRVRTDHAAGNNRPEPVFQGGNVEPFAEATLGLLATAPSQRPPLRWPIAVADQS